MEGEVVKACTRANKDLHGMLGDIVRCNHLLTLLVESCWWEGAPRLYGEMLARDGVELKPDNGLG
jgi:pentatricopeptide repeat protein